MLDVGNLTWSRTGLTIELPDGTMEEATLRAELDMERLKHFYELAAAGGYSYSMSITADTLAIMRRATSWIATYQWSRALFKVQYEGMSDAAIEEAVAARKEGYEGGMPPGACISEEEAVRRFLEGDQAYLPALKKEPLLVMLKRGKSGLFSTQVNVRVRITVTVRVRVRVGARRVRTRCRG